MTTSVIENNITFEEVLKLFTTMDSPEKSAMFREHFSLFLKTKNEEERKFIGSIMLSITQDNATQLLRLIKENRDVEFLDLLEKAIKKINK